MDLLLDLASGFNRALTFNNLLYCLIGVTVGTFVGVLPGLGAMVGISMLLPLTFYLPPDSAIIMLAGIYYGGEYGGSIAAILLNVPGTASSAVICEDGNSLARQGRAAFALFMAAMASFLGGSIGVILLMAFSPSIAKFSMSFSASDYFFVMLLGLIATASISRGSTIRSLVGIGFGLLLGMVGTDVSTGIQRYTFGSTHLVQGIGVAVIAMGLFGLAEIISTVGNDRAKVSTFRVRFSDMLPSRKEARKSVGPILRGAGLGSMLGALPGTGPTIASFLAYSMEKRIARDPARFGSGDVTGVIGPESANNAAAQTAFVPTLALGIPGSATMALILGGLMIHGITPGPMLMVEHNDLFWTLVASFWIGNLMLLVLNIPMVGLWVKLMRVPYRLLFPSIVSLICAGVYSIDRSNLDVYLVLILGLAGYGMKISRIGAAPMLMGFILGPAMEENLRRAMMLSRGDLGSFLHSSVSIVLLATCLSLLFIPLVLRFSRKLRRMV